MAHFSLLSNGNTNIQTAFRYQLNFPTIAAVGGTLNDGCTVYCVSAQIPRASQTPIEWHAPMGVISHQAGKRVIEPITLEFLVPASTADADNVYKILSTWYHSTFDLTTGVNLGKSNYAVDNVELVLLDQAGNAVHTFTLFRAFPTTAEFGTVNSEGTDLLKVSMTLTYDYFKLDGNIQV